MVFDLINGACWSVVYITAIIVGVKHKTWCIPKLSIFLNLSWEVLIVITRLANHNFNLLSFWIQLVWLLLDIGVLLTWILYEKREASFKKILFDIILFCVSFSLMFLMAYLLDKWELAAYLINLIMSCAFVVRAVKKPGKWQSRLIAICKLAGTLAATILSGFILREYFLLWLGGLCLLFDIWYVIMLRQPCNEFDL